MECATHRAGMTGGMENLRTRHAVRENAQLELEE